MFSFDLGKAVDYEMTISGMEEYIAADPIGFTHHELFSKLQKLSLEWRLNDPFASLV